MSDATNVFVGEPRSGEPPDIYVSYLHERLDARIKEGVSRRAIYTRAGFSKGLLSGFEVHWTNMSSAKTQDNLAHGLGMDRTGWRVEAERWASGGPGTRAAAQEPLELSFPILSHVIRRAEAEAPLSPIVAERLRRIATEAGVDFDRGTWTSILDAVQADAEHPPMRKTGPMQIVGGKANKKR